MTTAQISMRAVLANIYEYAAHAQHVYMESLITTKRERRWEKVKPKAQIYLAHYRNQGS